MKVSKLVNLMAMVAFAAFVFLVLNGCGLTEPKESAANANQLPDTKITSGPRANSESSYFVPLYWSGSDLDGVVESYILTVDGQTATVTRTDSTFKFAAANQDQQHTVSVAAVDDRGGVDPEPASVTFTATDVPPNTEIMIQGDPAQGATFGQGAVFTIVAVDDPDNGPEFSYRFKIDDGGAWSEWQNSGITTFSIDSKLGLLPEGSHKFIAQVRDAAMAVDETPAEFRFVASSTVKPSVSLTSQMNGQPFYVDSSAFSIPSGNTVSFSWTTTFNYAGAVSAGTRYRLNGGDWSGYSASVSTLSLSNVAPGSYLLEIQAKDIAAKESDVVAFAYQIVAAPLNEGVLVIDDGDGRLAGNPPAAGDQNVEGFYDRVLTAAGVRFAQWDILKQGAPTPGRGMGRYSTILWQSDEAFLLNFQKQIQLVTDYLRLGGNLWLVGWKTINLIAGTTPVANFDPTIVGAPTNASFVWNYLRIRSTSQTPGAPADFIGATGAAGHPDLNVDPAKNPIPPFQNRLSPIDMFTLRADGGAVTIYSFISDSGNPNFSGMTVGAKYLSSEFNVVVFGFPFYHVQESEAIAAAQQILTELGER